jgi:hypothetical protein
VRSTEGAADSRMVRRARFGGLVLYVESGGGMASPKALA